MRHWLIVPLSFLFALAFVTGAAVAKDSKGRFSDFNFTESPREPANPPEIGGSMFQAAAANTTVLGWWQFEDVHGGPDAQGWTAHDVTHETYGYFHVVGSVGGCDAVAPISGTKSMWCGQWPSSAEPWCGWVSLPGYGNDWNQSLETANVSSVTYTIKWDSEPGYDFTYIEWRDPSNPYWDDWVPDVSVNGGAGYYDGTGGPQTETSVSPFGPTKFRIHFTSDGAWSDEDGLWPTVEGAVTVDNLMRPDGTEDWEDEPCNATQSTDGTWLATYPPAFGLYAALHHGGSVLQEDPCYRQNSWLWGFFDDPAVTNYACGGHPLQGAVPYGPDANGFYLDNEIWSPWVPVVVPGGATFLQFLTYRDLPLDNLIFYVWHVRTRDNETGGCPSTWNSFNYVYYGGQLDWIRPVYDLSSLILSGADDIQVSLGAVDYCFVWCGIYGASGCHSHAPLFDQVRLVQTVPRRGPLWTVRDIDLWQDTFPENGGIGATDYARCDMAQDIIPTNRKRLCPGDSLKVVVTDPSGLADDNTGGRPGKAIYVFVKVTDRFGNPVAGKNGLALQSPDNKAWSTDPNNGLLRWPFVEGIAPAGWDAYRCDYAKTVSGGAVKDTYCVDLMDISAFVPTGWHGNENAAANVGIFAPGDVIHYFIAGKNALNQWSYYTRALQGQGGGYRTEIISEATASPCEWSVLPDAGRLPGDAGDVLFVDDADDRGGPAQFYFDFAFRMLNVDDGVDRYDVLGPSSVVGNSLAGRVKNIQTQIIGDPMEIYQKVLWNCSDLSRGLMGDGGPPNGGSSAEKSNDFMLCWSFLANHPDNPGWAYWGDDVVQDWSTLVGLGAVNVKGIYMNHTPAGGDQKTVTGIVSPQAFSVAATPWAPETFYVHGGCPVINDFDRPGATGASLVSHRYNKQTNAAAALYQATPNAAGTTARFFLAGFGFNFIRDDDTDGLPDYVTHLRKTLVWFENILDEPIGIDPLAFSNRLENTYPNPFNPATMIKYSIASAGHVSLKIYNAAGQLVRTLVDEEQIPRVEGFSASWNGVDNKGQNVASGVYFYRLTAKGFSENKKMVFLK